MAQCLNGIGITPSARRRQKCEVIFARTLTWACASGKVIWSSKSSLEGRVKDDPLSSPPISPSGNGARSFTTPLRHMPSWIALPNDQKCFIWRNKLSRNSSRTNEILTSHSFPVPAYPDRFLFFTGSTSIFFPLPTESHVGVCPFLVLAPCPITTGASHTGHIGTLSNRRPQSLNSLCKNGGFHEHI